MAGKSKFDWTAERAALLGTMPDRHLAQQLGITPVMVAYQRKQLGIKQYAAPSAWNAANDSLLGTKTDAALAQELGVPKHVVLNRRRELQIPAFGPSGWPAWPRKQVELLGTMPDAELAQQIGRSVSAVRQQRLTLGIKAYRGYPGAIVITPEMRRKLDALEPVLLQRYRDSGLPIARLEPWQIVDIAINEMVEKYES